MCCLLFMANRGIAQTIKPFNGPFPVPPANTNSLFYMQRTINRNTLIYEANYSTDGNINRKKPIKIYWIDYEDGEKISELTYAQNKFAYGVKAFEIEGTQPLFKINLVSYKKVDLYLKPKALGGYAIHVILKGKPCILHRVLVNITGGSSLNPDVSDVELTGKDISTGEQVMEKFKP
ncbi:MAG: DUF4833 domain-containing protein [Bacteroidota bacterium]